MTDLKILIAEDDRDLADLYKFELEGFGINGENIYICDNLVDCIDFIFRIQPDFAFIDNSLSDAMAVKSVRLSVALRATKSITKAYLATGSFYTDEKFQGELKERGFTGVIGKPFQFEDMIDALIKPVKLKLIS